MIFEALKTEINATMASTFVDRAMRLVNGVENAVDASWALFRSRMRSSTSIAHREMRRRIARIHTQTDGFIDFESPSGRRERVRFFRDISKIYLEWRRRIKADVGGLGKGESFDKSLGRVNHVPGEIMMALRDEFVRKANEVVSLLDDFQEGSNAVATLSEAKRVTTNGIISARITGRGLPRRSKGHSRATSIILRGLKGVLDDQEKALLENVLRGLDQLPRAHANKMFDAGTGQTLKGALNAVADEFSVGNMSERQLKLSMQTHFRAMIRRVAANATAMDQKILFLQTPATRKVDLAKGGGMTGKRAFTTIDLKKLQASTKGSGDSLGKFAGDKVLIMPFPAEFVAEVGKAAKVARKRFLRDVERAKKRAKKRES